MGDSLVSDVAFAWLVLGLVRILTMAFGSLL